MSAPQDHAAIVAAMVREFEFPRYGASLFASPDRRRSMLAFAAFDLELSRIADQVSQPLAGEMRLQWWSDAIGGVEHGGIGGHPVADEVLGALTREALSRDPLQAAISAHRFDLYDEPMPTLAALEVYCDDTQGGLIGAGENLPDMATRDAGRALGLARIVSRLAHDASRRRCFLPSDMMAAYGVTRDQVLAGEETPHLQALRVQLLDVARSYLDRACRAARAMPSSRRPAFLPLATLRYEVDALQRQPVFALPQPPSHLRVLVSQWWMMR